MSPDELPLAVHVTVLAPPMAFGATQIDKAVPEPDTLPKDASKYQLLPWVSVTFVMVWIPLPKTSE